MKISLYPMRLFPSLALAALAACSTTHQDLAPAARQDAEKTAQPQLPPGWTEADMQACVAALTPGAPHQQLARSIGHWSGTSTQWMAPGSEPVKSKVSCDFSDSLGGRFVKSEYSGDVPGMGPFHGLGFQGYDNVSQKYVSTWIDDCATGIMTGEGIQSEDGKTMTWTYRFNCPMTKQPMTMRQVEHWTGDNSMVLEMFGADPHSGQEYKMMSCELVRAKP